MDFPTPEIQQELLRIPRSSVGRWFSELREPLVKRQQACSYFCCVKRCYWGPTRDECAFNFAGLLASHQKLATDLEPAEDMGLI